MKTEKILITSLLLTSVILFFVFGFFHLTKFETTDEHLWKYGRIKQYWQAIENKNWEKTYINDKPGVTVALISGIGLLSEPDPESHKITNAKLTQNGLFEIYDTAKTERINFLFRFPVLLFSSLSLFLFFWLIKKAFNSSWLALFSVMFMAFSPILVGISQIINPDSFFWIFGGLSIFSFLALLNTEERKFLVFCGIFTGFALLSKYTATTLFVFYFLAILSKIIFQKEENAPKLGADFLLKNIFNVLLIFIASLIIFSLFLPAVLVKPEYLFKGVSQFLDWKNIFLILIILALSATVLLWKKIIFEKITDFLIRKKRIILILTSCLFLFIIISLCANVWTGQKFAPLDEMRDTAYAKEPKQFNFGTLIKNDGFLEKKSKLILMETYPLIFSLTPLSLLLVIFLAGRITCKKNDDDEKSSLFFSLISFSLIYFALTISARVVTNARYLILLYPLLAFLSALAFMEVLKILKLQQKEKYLTLSAILILLSGTLTLFSIKPFYFNYTNFLLPSQYTIHHSWGHGAYEAAQYLNSLPDAKNLIIRSSTNTICPFLKGKCLKSRKIDLNLVKPDYFVVTRRGELKERDRFLFINSNPKNDSHSYYDNILTTYDWAIYPGNHPDNYLKIIKFKE